jgi:hypothetical protein
MLFLVNDGVPSVAKWVRLDAAAADVAAIPPDPPPDPDPDPEPVPEPTPDPDPTPDREPEPDPDPDDPVALPDFAGPTLRLDFPERRWLRRLRRTGNLRVKVTVDEPATIDLRLLRRNRPVARTRADVRAGTHRVKLRPRRRVLRWLRRADAPRLRFAAVALDAAGNDTAWARLLGR